MCVSDTPDPGKNIAESIRSYNFIVNIILRFIQIFCTQSHIIFFNQEVKYLRIFKYQINRYERTQENMNANHKFETKSIGI